MLGRQGQASDFFIKAKGGKAVLSPASPICVAGERLASGTQEEEGGKGLTSKERWGCGEGEREAPVGQRS